MKKEEIEFIRDWFYSDLDIEMEISNEKQKGIIILESNAYYYEGKRYKGDKRKIIYDTLKNILKSFSMGNILLMRLSIFWSKLKTMALN